MGKPRLILLDEPSTGLDPFSRRFLWNTMQSYFYKQKRSAILTTHNMEEADNICTKIGIMSRGSLRWESATVYWLLYLLRVTYAEWYYIRQKVSRRCNICLSGLEQVSWFDLAREHKCAVQHGSNVEFPIKCFGKKYTL